MKHWMKDKAKLLDLSRNLLYKDYLPIDHVIICVIRGYWLYQAGCFKNDNVPPNSQEPLETFLPQYVIYQLLKVNRWVQGKVPEVFGEVSEHHACCLLMTVVLNYELRGAFILTM